ncbi:acetyl-CoA carboxylase biotin carboxyl carrier protein [Clostridium botulinum]|uniref:Biotin carboxyl carrier protein of acetyl-CoA carboxylase n=1 Tax=Clostridium botulinum TaxID=1491 RepID=A0A9Q1ZDD7_CLOBO|nr:acetyl-CoA carboxylase biotin carboxyl carrier protein [Clostridium botulinum]AEB76653.1 acetyl-CoA carboxylase, biotin carboxyl carrier subunit [Clostridium botulinum BKT015925]KLU76171.1 acetyl-CoA carboxylase [Clostridium botulinum V891]KOA73069.1 acetyl-CoA carboxylase [Clostridium botulinum]KOA79349.1 acetyl-CoA carboxylase [Clostridium botulinum]KOA85565.1 acetyl-CoA carboxylase [Clostridium botulinum]
MITLDYKEICEIIKVVSDSNLYCAEIKIKEMYMKMSKGSVEINNINSVNKEDEKREQCDIDLQIDKSIINKEKSNILDDIEIIKSPLVGTFYRASSPESEPYVNLGFKINENDVLCIVEAMKLMNEIEAGVKGEIVEILVGDGEMVEYNQPLFKIKKD